MQTLTRHTQFKKYYFYCFITYPVITDWFPRLTVSNNKIKYLLKFYWDAMNRFWLLICIKVLRQRVKRTFLGIAFVWCRGGNFKTHFGCTVFHNPDISASLYPNHNQYLDDCERGHNGPTYSLLKWSQNHNYY